MMVGSVMPFTVPPPVIRQPWLHRTAIVTGPELLFAGSVSIAGVTVAMSEIDGQLLASVTADTMTCVLLPDGSVPKVQVSVVPTMVQAPASGPDGVQLRPAGRVSVSTTSFDGPGPFAVTTRSY